MQICKNKHKPIAHTEGWQHCPLCASLDEAAKQREVVSDLLDALRGISEDTDVHHAIRKIAQDAIDSV
jgi:hypothetical protein